MSEPIKARVFKGTRDILPEELMARNQLVATLVQVFERYGFGPLETPAMEHLDILLGKYGPEGEKLIYKLAYKGGEVLALRYDLTVPLSRVVAMNANLPLPFKRYQIQPVWRADRPQIAQGRFREFIQCDVDTVGTSSISADAENVAVVHDGVRALGLEQFQVRINNRKLLRGIVEWSGLDITREADLLRTVDKLDKIGIEGVRKELRDLSIPEGPSEKVLEVMQVTGTPDEVMNQTRKTVGNAAAAAEGLDELRALFDGVAQLGVAEERLELDLYLTRGLDYYTGPVYEVALTAIDKFGSLGGGGRYDDLMGLYGKHSIPATGVSIGLSRVLAALQQMDLLKTRRSPSDVLLMRFPDTPESGMLNLARDLRAGGVPCEIYYDQDRLKKQFTLAERKGIPIAALLGTSEIEAGTVNLKHVESGEQVTVKRSDAPAKIREWIATPPERASS